MKAVPESFSAYSPRGGFCGEFAPIGSAPSTASVLGYCKWEVIIMSGGSLLMIGNEAILISILFFECELCCRHLESPYG